MAVIHSALRGSVEGQSGTPRLVRRWHARRRPRSMRCAETCASRTKRPLRGGGAPRSVLELMRSGLHSERSPFRSIRCFGCGFPQKILPVLEKYQLRWDTGSGPLGMVLYSNFDPDDFDLVIPRGRMQRRPPFARSDSKNNCRQYQSSPSSGTAGIFFLKSDAKGGRRCIRPHRQGGPLGQKRLQLQPGLLLKQFLNKISR